MGLLEEKIDKLESHFRIYKTDVSDMKDSLRDIKHSLIGTEFDGKKGMVFLLDDINKRVRILEDKQILDDKKSKTLEWFERGVIGVIFAYIGYLLTQLK